MFAVAGAVQTPGHPQAFFQGTSARADESKGDSWALSTASEAFDSGQGTEGRHGEAERFVYILEEVQATSG